MEFLGKVAIVTGAGAGIGKAVALALAENGADVVVNSIGGVRAEQVAANIKALGRRSLAFAADVSKAVEVQGIVEKTVEEFGTVDILVNNAGVSTPLLIDDMTEKDWDWVVNTNLKGAFLCSKAVTSIMQKNRYGKIINISSTAAHRLSWGSGANYAASKAGLLALTRQIAYELAHFNINVNAVCPGPTRTEISARTEKEIEQERQLTPIGRWSTPEDQAQAVLFLASEKARQIVGVALDIDGGRSLASGTWEDYLSRRRRFSASRTGKEIRKGFQE
jgi:3-oxoacyl-[acyl-carrier protein] reductase